MPAPHCRNGSCRYVRAIWFPILPILDTNLWSQDNVYKPIEFEVKSTNFEVNKLEQDFHDESNGSVASDIIITTPRTTAASKKIIPSIGDYKKLFIIA